MMDTFTCNRVNALQCPMLVLAPGVILRNHTSAGHVCRHEDGPFSSLELWQGQSYNLVE